MILECSFPLTLKKPAEVFVVSCSSLVSFAKGAFRHKEYLLQATIVVVNKECVILLTYEVLRRSARRQVRSARSVDRSQFILPIQHLSIAL